MPMLAPPTTATLAPSLRSISDRSLTSELGQEALGVGVEDFVEDLRWITLRAPIRDEPLVVEKRIVGAEQNAILEPARDLVLEIGGVVLRRLAVQLVPDAALVHEDGDHLGLPRPPRAGGDDPQLRIARGDEIEMAGMAVIENDSVASGQPRTEARRANEDQHGNAGLDAQVVVGLIGRLARRRRQRRRDGVAEEPALVVDAPPELLGAVGASPLRIDVDPVTEDRVGMRRLGRERIVVQGLHLLERPEL